MKAHIQHQIFGYIIFFFRFSFISCITYLMQIELSYSYAQPFSILLPFTIPVICFSVIKVPSKRFLFLSLFIFFKTFDVLFFVFSCLCTTHFFSLNCKCAMLIQTSYIIHIFINFCLFIGPRPLGRHQCWVLLRQRDRQHFSVSYGLKYIYPLTWQFSKF